MEKFKKLLENEKNNLLIEEFNLFFDKLKKKEYFNFDTFKNKMERSKNFSIKEINFYLEFLGNYPLEEIKKELNKLKLNAN